MFQFLLKAKRTNPTLVVERQAAHAATDVGFGYSF